MNGNTNTEIVIYILQVFHLLFKPIVETCSKLDIVNIFRVLPEFCPRHQELNIVALVLAQSLQKDNSRIENSPVRQDSTIRAMLLPKET